MHPSLQFARVTLDQWSALHAVVETGGFSAAAERLGKSQSTVSYAVKQIEQQLGIAVLQQVGRKAQLTEVGEAVWRRAKRLLEDAQALEQLAQVLKSGVETQLAIAVEVIYPKSLLADLLSDFAGRFPGTRLELYESVLSGGQDLLINRQVELLVTSFVPTGYLGEELQTIEFVCVAHPKHSLHQHEQVTPQELRKHRQLVVRDSGAYRRLSAPWLEAEKRWTVSNLDTSLRLLSNGMGFAWVPYHYARPYLQQQTLKALPLETGQQRKAQLYLVHADKECCGPAAKAIAQLFRDRTQVTHIT